MRRYKLRQGTLREHAHGEWVKLDDVIECLILNGYLVGDKPVAPVPPRHGSCCTCQECGHGHDECVCDHNSLLADLLGAKR